MFSTTQVGCGGLHVCLLGKGKLCKISNGLEMEQVL